MAKVNLNNLEKYDSEYERISHKPKIKLPAKKKKGNKHTNKDYIDWYEDSEQF